MSYSSICIPLAFESYMRPFNDLPMILENTFSTSLMNLDIDNLEIPNLHNIVII